MGIKIKKGFVLRKIGPQYMAVPYGAMAGEVKGMVTLTESAYMLWQAIDRGVDDIEGLTSVLTEAYEVEHDVALKDASDFIIFLARIGALDA